jgi:hypothetical protein
MQVRHAGKLVLMHIRGRLPITSGRPSTEHTVHIRACSGTVSSDATSALGGVVLHNNRAGQLGAIAVTSSEKRVTPQRGRPGALSQRGITLTAVAKFTPPTRAIV